MTSVAKHVPPTVARAPEGGLRPLSESGERPASARAQAICAPVVRPRAGIDASVVGKGHGVFDAQSKESRPGKGRSRTARRAREYQRISVRCGCWLEHEQATVYGTTVDLGRGGLFLRTALPMPTGISVRVTLRLPGQETVVADGKIVRTVAPQAGDRPGLGVRFERLPDGDDSLCAFLFGSIRDEQEAAELGKAALLS